MISTRPFLPSLFLAICCYFSLAAAPAGEKMIIAHRGASGNLPEHTLESYALAYGQGAHYIEPDLLVTRDGHLIALHDQTLDATTNVAEVFPEKARPDGRFYAIDFSLEEIKQLRVNERINPITGQQVYPGRFPASLSAPEFRIPTLEEILELVQGLNRSTGRDVGIYPETKSPSWHREQGQEIERILLSVLHRYDYRTREDNVIIQSFERESLLRLRELGSEHTIVQLIGGRGRENDAMATPEGLDRIAEYADGIGPAMTRIIDVAGRPVSDNELVREAHRRGLKVHPYTMRADQLPAYAEGFENLLERFLFEAGVDGVFTDHPGDAVEFLRARK